MQITLINDFNNGPRQFTAQEIASYLQDEQTAVNMLNATFTNNISLTFNVGFGSYQGRILPSNPQDPTADPQSSAVAAPNTINAVFLTYTALRNNLLTKGQPNFFTPTNLPAGNSIPGFGTGRLKAFATLEVT